MGDEKYNSDSNGLSFSLFGLLYCSSNRTQSSSDEPVRSIANICQMTSPYAANTTVSAEKSRAELETLLSKHGSTQRGIQVDDMLGVAIVAFVVDGNKFRIEVPLPKKQEGFGKPSERPRGWYAWSEDKRRQYFTKAWEQSCRERWRAVVLLVKSKLEIVRIGMSSIEKEFMADLVLPNGKTVQQQLAAQILGGKTKVLMLGEGD